MINHEAVKAELAFLTKLKAKIDKCIRNAPEGSVYYVSAGKTTDPIPFRNRNIEGKRVRTSLKKHERKLLIPLKFKTYAKHLKRRVDGNIRALKAILRYQPFDADFLSFGGAPFQECRDYFFGTAPDNPEFEALEERQNPSHPEQLNIKTELGVFRSREEYIVARALTMLGLRFKYETPLFTPYRCLYPDFAVLHPVTSQIIYIEYSGRMKSTEYRVSVLSRLKDYGNAGLYLGYNLFYISTISEEGIDVSVIMNRLKGIFDL